MNAKALTGIVLAFGSATPISAQRMEDLIPDVLSDTVNVAMKLDDNASYFIYYTKSGEDIAQAVHCVKDGVQKDTPARVILSRYNRMYTDLDGDEYADSKMQLMPPQTDKPVLPYAIELNPLLTRICGRQRP